MFHKFCTVRNTVLSIPKDVYLFSVWLQGKQLLQARKAGLKIFVLLTSVFLLLSYENFVQVGHNTNANGKVLEKKRTRTISRGLRSN